MTDIKIFEIRKNLFKNPRRKKKKSWKIEEDNILRDLISIHGSKNWMNISNYLSCSNPYSHKRTAQQCRERWNNKIKGTAERKLERLNKHEERILFESQLKYGNKWIKISNLIPGRNENNLKNHYYSQVRKLIRKTLIHLNEQNFFEKNQLNFQDYTISKIQQVVKLENLPYLKLSFEVLEILFLKYKNKINDEFFFVNKTNYWRLKNSRNSETGEQSEFITNEYCKLEISKENQMNAKNVEKSEKDIIVKNNGEISLIEEKLYIDEKTNEKNHNQIDFENKTNLNLQMNNYITSKNIENFIENKKINSFNKKDILNTENKNLNDDNEITFSNNNMDDRIMNLDYKNYFHLTDEIKNHKLKNDSKPIIEKNFFFDSKINTINNYLKESDPSKNYFNNNFNKNFLYQIYFQNKCNIENFNDKENFQIEEIINNLATETNNDLFIKTNNLNNQNFSSDKNENNYYNYVNIKQIGSKGQLLYDDTKSEKKNLSLNNPDYPMYHENKSLNFGNYFLNKNLISNSNVYSYTDDINNINPLFFQYIYNNFDFFFIEKIIKTQNLMIQALREENEILRNQFLNEFLKNKLLEKIGSEKIKK